MRYFSVFVTFLLLFSQNVLAFNLPNHESGRSPKFFRAIKSLFVANSLEITVLDQEGLALEDALVMIGNSPGEPFEENVEYSDADGKAFFSNGKLKPPYTVTAYKEGFNAYTIYEIDAEKIEIKLTPLASSNEYVEINGELNNWQQMVNGDDLFSSAFVTPLLFFDEIVNFNFSTLLGPDCKIDIYGERDIPCNVVIPEQRETYFFVPVALHKPNYILRAKKDKDQDFLALSGDIPFTSSVDLLIGGGSFEMVLDQLKVRKIGLKLDQLIDKNETLNIPLDYTVRLNQINVEVNNRPLNRSMVLLSLVDYQNKSKQFIPTGMRVISRREGFKRKSLSSVVKNGLLQDSKDLVIGAAVDLPENKDDRENDSKIIGILTRNTESNVVLDSFFLPLELSLSDSNLILSDVMNKNISPNPDLNFASLRRMIKDKQNGQEHETVWAVVTPAAQKTIKLPQLPISIIPDPSLTPDDDKLYWTAGVFALDQEQTMFDYDLISHKSIAKRLTHFSWNRIEVEGNVNQR